MANKKSGNKEENFTKAVGTPTALLLPARNYKFVVFNEEYKITIPRKGKYVDLDPEMFSEDDGEFEVLQSIQDKKGNDAKFIYIPELSKLLFATGQYPALDDTQAFVPLALIVKEEGVEIIGQLIEMVKGN